MPNGEKARAMRDANLAYQAEFDEGGLGKEPSTRVAIVTCMDARINPYRMLGLENGEAHLIRNAGGVISNEVIRSLCLSQRSLGTREIVLIHHTQCGVQGIDETAFLNELERETGNRPTWRVYAFDDPFEDVRLSMELLRNSPFLPHTDAISGFVYDVENGALLAAG
ncbi:MAG: beta-class carbonic anhydrase [Acidimicrobiales bacterium]